MVDGFEHVVENGVERSFCASSGSRSAMILGDPTMSANSTVDLFAFSFEIAVRRHYPGRTEIWSIDIRRQKAVYRSMLVIKSNWVCALGAEFGSRRDQAPTIGTAALERSGTLLTELRFRPIVVFAPGALHLNRQLSGCTRRDILPGRIEFNNLTAVCAAQACAWSGRSAPCQ